VSVIVLVVIVVAALAVVLLTRHHGSSNKTQPTSSPSPVQTATASVSPSTVSASPTESPSASPSPTPSPSHSATPLPALSQADKQQISDNLQTYFSAINAGDYRTAWEQFTPRLKRQAPLAKFAEGDSTTQDSNVVIHWIKRTGTASAVAYVTFTSTQAAAYGPNHDTRDDWTLDYTMVLVNGRWRIDGTTGHNGVKYTPS
jgi:cytoskeletal protein RodZ